MRRFFLGRFLIHLLGLAAAAAVTLHPGLAVVRPDLGFIGAVIGVLVYFLFAWIAAAPVRTATIETDGASHVRGIFRGFLVLFAVLIPVVLIFFKTVELTVAAMMADLPPEMAEAMAAGEGGPPPAGPPPFDPALIPDALAALGGEMPLPLLIWIGGALIGALVLTLPALLAVADRFTPPAAPERERDSDVPPAGA
ncbi:MAG: hypothetical protein RLO50_16565 [Azospirillaceae bacterium]